MGREPVPDAAESEETSVRGRRDALADPYMAIRSGDRMTAFADSELVG
ncbi:MAG: hypothetical protein ACRDRN_02705 [Sciscionella sp.]